METRNAAKLLTCLCLCASAAGLPVHDSIFRNSATHNLNAGLQVLRNISVSITHSFCECTNLLRRIMYRSNIAPPPFVLQVQLANSLQLPAQRWDELTSTGDVPLRTALEMTCTLHSHVNTFSRLQRELPNDIEVNAVYEVLKQNRNNSCHWVSAHYKSRACAGIFKGGNFYSRNFYSLEIFIRKLSLNDDSKQVKKGILG